MQAPQKVISNTMQMVLFVLIGSVFVVLLSFLNTPKWLLFILILSASLLVFTVYPMFLIYRSNRLEAIDRYIIRNRKKPLFSYAYALAYEEDAQVVQALEEILKKYKQPMMQTMYQANLYVHQKEVEQLRMHAETIENADLKAYYKGLADALAGNLIEADEQLKVIQTPWMLHSLKATLAFERQQLTVFEQEVQRAVDAARGLQKYGIYHSLKRTMRPDS